MLKAMSPYAVFIIVVFSAQNASAFDPWDQDTKARHVVFTQLKIIDCLQTLKIAREPDKYYEINPLLGRHPEQWQVLGFFIGTYALETALVHVLPSDYRQYAQYFFIGVSGTCVVNNLTIGLGFGF